MKMHIFEPTFWLKSKFNLYRKSPISGNFSRKSSFSAEKSLILSAKVLFPAEKALKSTQFLKRFQISIPENSCLAPI